MRPVRGAYSGTRGPSRKAVPGNSWVLPRQPRGGPGGAPAAWPSVRWGVWARSASRAVLSRGGRAAPSSPPPARHTVSAFNTPSVDRLFIEGNHTERRPETTDTISEIIRNLFIVHDTHSVRQSIFVLTTSVPARGHKLPSSPRILT